MSISKIFDIPEYYYFEAGNEYLGSLNGLNFKIGNGENLVCYIYYGMKCFQLSEIVNKKDFHKSKKGYEDLISWLESVYLEYKDTPNFKIKSSLI